MTKREEFVTLLSAVVQGIASSDIGPTALDDIPEFARECAEVTHALLNEVKIFCDENDA